MMCMLSLEVTGHHASLVFCNAIGWCEVDSVDHSSQEAGSSQSVVNKVLVVTG